MESIGETLRQARENRRVSLEDASRVTKVKLDILQHLEADEFDRLAGPMYAKGFLKLYAEYLGLDAQVVMDSYLRSQGGLRRQGLKVETEATIRARKPNELHLPMRRVVTVVAALSLVVALGFTVKSFWRKRHAAPSTAPAQTAIQTPPTTTPTPPAPAPAPAPRPLPKADFEPYYQPRTKPPPEILEPPGK